MIKKIYCTHKVHIYYSEEMTVLSYTLSPNMTSRFQTDIPTCEFLQIRDCWNVRFKEVSDEKQITHKLNTCRSLSQSNIFSHPTF